MMSPYTGRLLIVSIIIIIIIFLANVFLPKFHESGGGGVGFHSLVVRVLNIIVLTKVPGKLQDF